MTTTSVFIHEIKIGPRLRSELGDIEDLADSLDRFGLIQPVVLDDQNNLIAGGRRLAAAQFLGWNDIKVCYLGSLTDDERAELELEENIRRKDMTWQERVLSIATIHAKKKHNSALSNTTWGQRETGEMLGMTSSNVNYALWAASRLREGDDAVRQCAHMAEVVRLMLERKNDEAFAELAKRQEDAPVVASQITEIINGVEETRDEVSVMLPAIQEDSIQWMQRAVKNGVTVDHIVTDPPYAIDMDNIQQDGGGMNVERTVEQHQIIENQHLLGEFLRLSYRVTRDNAFCVFWTDQDNWEGLKHEAIAVGWRVQRWPLVWIKTDPCQNMAAQYNFTKRTEIAMVLRKPGATLQSAQPSNYWVGSGEDKTLYNHPFAKPLDLWQWVIEAVSQDNQTILDPFAGVGTCPCAAVRCGRRPIAVEKVDIHYNQCVENLKEAYRRVHGQNVRFV